MILGTRAELDLSVDQCHHNHPMSSYGSFISFQCDIGKNNNNITIRCETNHTTITSHVKLFFSVMTTP